MTSPRRRATAHWSASAASPMTGPATPKHAADERSRRATHDRSSRERRHHREQGSLKSRRGELDAISDRARSSGVTASNNPRSVLVPPDVANKKHLALILLQLTSGSFSFILEPFPPSVTEADLSSPSPDLQGSHATCRTARRVHGKLSSARPNDARALVTRLGGATADDVNAKTTMVVVGGEGLGSWSRARQELQAETRRRA